MTESRKSIRGFWPLWPARQARPDAGRPGAGRGPRALPAAPPPARPTAVLRGRQRPPRRTKPRARGWPDAAHPGSAARELVLDPRDHALPIVDFRLPEQPCGRVPGIVAALAQPPPIRDVLQQHPDRLAHGAG